MVRPHRGDRAVHHLRRGTADEWAGGRAGSESRAGCHSKAVRAVDGSVILPFMPLGSSSSSLQPTGFAGVRLPPTVLQP